MQEITNMVMKIRENANQHEQLLDLLKRNSVASSGFLSEPEDLQVTTTSFIEYKPNLWVRSSKISLQVSHSPEYSLILMVYGASQESDGQSSQSNGSSTTQPMEPAISGGAKDASQCWIQAYMGTNLTPEEVKRKDLHSEQTTVVLANYYGRKMEEVEPCSDLATKNPDKDAV
ncbi:MAG: hypothetical protein EZS28_021458 [Streblomastix strix]|uniref:Uncharacterized protein n=1 Tax=Streblomastix strix TaxID=222440 RepID=A0A5J4VKN3_9EUKA|nr:MAG: hypothetical protein EZS28_021458 [Streblomastix strix]